MNDRPTESIRISTGTVKTILLVGSVLSVLATGALGAVKFYLKAGDAVSSAAFAKHIELDSIRHAMDDAHHAFQDSIIARQQRDLHAIACFVTKDRTPLCTENR